MPQAIVIKSMWASKGGIVMFMTMEEINEKFDGEWIYAIDCEENDAGTVLGGKVVFHSPNHDDVMKAMTDYDKNILSLTYFRYVGEIPEGTSLLL